MKPNLKAFLQGFLLCLVLTIASLLVKVYVQKEVVNLDLAYYIGHLVICIICGFAVVFIKKRKAK